MEEFLFHYKYVIAYFTLGVFILRYLINGTIHTKTGSQSTHNRSNKYDFIPMSSAEKELLEKQYPNIANVQQEEHSLISALTIALSFWWSKQVWDTRKITKLKLIANILNLYQLGQIVFWAIYFLYFQGNDFLFEGQIRDPWYFLN